MSYERRENKRLKRKNKKLRQKRIRKILVMVFFIYLIFRSLPDVLAKQSRTVIPIKHTLIDNLETQGIVIMDEKIFPTAESINVQEDLEGKRIPVNLEVASIKGTSGLDILEEELEKVQTDIDIFNNFKKNNKIIEKDMKKVEQSQKELIDNLKNKIHAGDYSDIELIKEEIIKEDNKISEFTPTNTLIDQSLESLIERKNKLLNDINNKTIVYNSKMAGILSYNIDGYEKKYIPREFENYTYDSIEIPKKLSNKNKKDFNGFKIINNFEWYIAFKIESVNDIKKYNKGDYILLNFKDSPDKIKGKIIELNKSGDNIVVIVKFTTDLDKYYKERFIEANIIIKEEDVYKIPTKTLVNNEDQVGVYIKELNGIVRFKPVSIIKEDNDYTYVDIGDNNGLIEIEESKDPVKTITSYDEIFLNPFSIKEGQVLD